MPFARTNTGPSYIRDALRGVAELVRLGGPAWLVVGASLALSMLSIYSIDVAESVKVHSTFELGHAAMKQFVFLCVGMGAAVIVAIPHYRWLGYASWVLLGISVALLVFLLIPFVPASLVRPRNGARSWIDLGPVDFQPSEVAKIAYVLVIAWYLRYRKNHRTFLGLVPPAIITFVPVALITVQPELGTGLLFIPVLGAMLIAAGAKLKHLTVIVLIAMMAAPAAYPLLMRHQKDRIKGLLMQVQGDSTEDQGTNMQSVTAQRLVGAGGFAGAGNEKARTLLHFNALPERHTDMIYAVVCDRFGLLGGLFAMALYGVWVIGALLTAGMCREPFGRLIVVGLTGFLAAQVFINIGMNLGLVPIIGITLPYLSYGGSSMVTVWLMTGLIVSIAVRRPRMLMRRSFEFEDEE
jgi:cell division protein FtsW (lipid II flippase)